MQEIRPLFSDACRRVRQQSATALIEEAADAEEPSTSQTTKSSNKTNICGERQSCDLVLDACKLSERAMVHWWWSDGAPVSEWCRWIGLRGKQQKNPAKTAAQSCASASGRSWLCFLTIYSNPMYGRASHGLQSRQGPTGAARIWPHAPVHVMSVCYVIHDEKVGRRRRWLEGKIRGGRVGDIHMVQRRASEWPSAIGDVIGTGWRMSASVALRRLTWAQWSSCGV